MIKVATMPRVQPTQAMRQPSHRPNTAPAATWNSEAGTTSTASGTDCEVSASDVAVSEIDQGRGRGDGERVSATGGSEQAALRVAPVDAA